MPTQTKPGSKPDIESAVKLAGDPPTTKTNDDPQQDPSKIPVGGTLVDACSPLRLDGKGDPAEPFTEKAVGSAPLVLTGDTAAQIRASAERAFRAARLDAVRKLALQVLTSHTCGGICPDRDRFCVPDFRITGTSPVGVREEVGEAKAVRMLRVSVTAEVRCRCILAELEPVHPGEGGGGGESASGH